MNAITSSGSFAPGEQAAGAREALLSIDLVGGSGTLWRLLVEAGASGVTSADMSDALYGSRKVPASWPMLRARHLAQLRPHADARGLAIDISRATVPVRWALAAKPAPEPPPPAAPAIEPARVQRRGAPGVRTIVPIRFDGIPAAVDALSPRSCRWLLDAPGADGALFCSEAIVDEGKSYCPEHRRRATDRSWPPRKVA